MLRDIGEKRLDQIMEIIKRIISESDNNDAGVEAVK